MDKRFRNWCRTWRSVTLEPMPPQPRSLDSGFSYNFGSPPHKCGADSRNGGAYSIDS